MSTSESMISEIDSAYHSAISLVSAIQGKFKNDAMPIDDGRQLLDGIVKFQRFMESRELRLRAYKGAPYYDRASGIFVGILERTRSTEPVRTIRYADFEGFGQVYYGKGLTMIAREFLGACRTPSRNLQKATLIALRAVLDEMEPDLVEFYADLRLMTESEIFPFEKRMELKDRLVRSGFSDVVDNLESAEQNLSSSPPHLKDVLPNCRLSIEAMFYSLMERKGVPPKRKFSFDLATFSQTHPEVIDDGTKQMIQGVFSYLSVKGSHAISPTDKAVLPEIELGLEMTYRMISLLLSKVPK